MTASLYTAIVMHMFPGESHLKTRLIVAAPTDFVQTSSLEFLEHIDAALNCPYEAVMYPDRMHEAVTYPERTHQRVACIQQMQIAVQTQTPQVDDLDKECMATPVGCTFATPPWRFLSRPVRMTGKAIANDRVAVGQEYFTMGGDAAMR